MMPQGSMWLDGSLYVAAPPVIWKLTDADGDGVAERREEWVKTTAVTGCLNDLRGPYLGPDGYIYWCKGPATQTYSVAGRPWTSAARHVLRRHPQGRDVDVLMVGGMDNLIEIAISPEGERFVTSTLFQMLGKPRDDGILHAVYGTVYPKDIAPIFEFPWTSPDLMPAMTSWGAMSPAGLMCYQSSALGPDIAGICSRLCSAATKSSAIRWRRKAERLPRVTKTSWSATILAFIRRMCWKTPTAACW